MLNKSSLSLVQSVDHDEQIFTLSLVQSVDHDEQIFTLIGPVSSSSSKPAYLYVDVRITSYFLRKDMVLTLYICCFSALSGTPAPFPTLRQYLLSDRLNPPATIVHEYGEFSARNPGSFDRGRFVANNPSYRLLIGSEKR
jgi:hypothetical protein